MIELKLAYLFKRKNIKFENKTYEIFLYRDVVMGFLYNQGVKGAGELFHITTENSVDNYASVLDINENERLDNIVVPIDTNTFLKNKPRLNFNMMKEIENKNRSKYYIRGDKCSLTTLNNTNLIKIADKEFSEINSDFDEDELDKKSDISEMYSSIKKTIVSQDEQIMMILTALFKNQKVVNSNMDVDLMAKLKENILIYGSTGTGKTEILKRISKLYKIPIIIQDATTLSETGYQGRKIQDMLIDLISAANGNLDLAEKGILVIDEFDKLAEKGDQSHVSRIGVQRGLLKLLDGVEFYLDNKKFNTSKLTIVCLGAFTGISNKENNPENDFSNFTNVDNYKKITTEDFTKYGIIRELIGRFSKFVAMNPLKEEDIVKILVTSNFSPLNTYKTLFDMMEIKFEYTEEFVSYLARKATNLNSGARGLKTVFDECISGVLFRVFAGEYSNISLVKPKSEEDRPYVLTKKNNKPNIYKK